MIYVSIDLETTGTDPENNQILEFGAVIEDTSKNTPLEDLPNFQVYIDNGELIVGNAFALQMNHKILKRIATKEEGYEYIQPEVLGELFYGFLQDHGFEPEMVDEDQVMKITVAGKNFGAFDLQFLNECPWFNESVRIKHRLIDPAVLYVNWATDTELPNLEECKNRAGFPGEVSHNAVEDAIDVIKVLRPFYPAKKLK